MTTNTPEPMGAGELLPCPFCGNSANVRDDFQYGQDGGGFCYAVCELCGVRGVTVLASTPKRIVCEQDRISAMRAWNRRAHPAPAGPGLLEGEREALERLEKRREFNAVTYSDIDTLCATVRRLSRSAERATTKEPSP